MVKTGDVAKNTRKGKARKPLGDIGLKLRISEEVQKAEWPRGKSLGSPEGNDG